MPADDYRVDFPTLWVVPSWIERHLPIPDGFNRGAAFTLSNWQLWCMVNHYRVKPDAVWQPKKPILAPAFQNRRSQVVGPQKALALDTPIAIPTGWTTMGALAVGDQVFDEAGQPTRVLSKSQVWSSDTYRVTLSDGATVDACGDHLWSVDRRTSSGTYVTERVTTRHMVADGLVDSGGARKYRVPVARPLHLPDVDLPIDPYVLGAWLGDGSKDDGRLTGLDREIFDRVASAGYEVRQTKVAKRVQVIGLKVQLRDAGVLGNKHIPPVYLRASEAQRWALLQGLMDTDGHADQRGRCEFSTTTPALRDGIRELLYTLGIKHVMYGFLAKLNGRVTGPAWRISFAARSDQPVFHLERHQRRLMPPGRSHAQYRHRRIVAIDPIEAIPTQCITVAATSHLFLAGREMIPTGNSGKGPFGAAIVCNEARGPALFAGWAGKDDGYVCAEHGCSCGWEYPYQPGDPMGMLWPTPLIHLSATSEDQVDNVYRPLKAMIANGPLAERMWVRETFIRLPNDGEIAVVTAAADSRLGNPITFALQDETGLYTKANKLKKVAETQRRNAAGMGGRTMELTNCWDPAEQSVAQDTAEALAEDIFRFQRTPPAHLSYTNKRERRRIHKYVYEGSDWVDLDAIEGEAAELAEKDPGQAERFFGNRVVRGKGVWLPDGLWDNAGPEESVA